MWCLILDPDWWRLERCDVWWDHGVRRPFLFWDDRVLLLHHTLHLRKLYPSAQMQTKTAETENPGVQIENRKWCLHRQWSFSECFVQTSSWMSSWLSPWTTWQMQSLWTPMKETRKGDISLPLCVSFWQTLFEEWELWMLRCRPNVHSIIHDTLCSFQRQKGW